jgi:hypothetical protein
MRKLFASLLLTSLALPCAHGQANTAPPPRPLPPKAATSTLEKSEKPAAENPAPKRSLAQRLFGPRPTPTPTPTPAPVVKRRPVPKPKPAPAETATDATEKVTPKAPAPGTTTAVKPKSGKGGAKKGAPADTDPSALDDGTKFKNAKAKAQEDPHVQELKNKADSEVNESEAQKALVNYNRALFQKIREIDPSVSDYAGKVEQALSRRVGADKAKE